MPLKITVTKTISKPAAIKLSQPVASNSAAAAFDVLQIKKSLNRLGYYIPPEDIGITDIPDAALFTAIKTFQKSLGLSVTGIINPDDATLAAINAELQKPQRGYYVWHTVHDDHVRADHAAKDGMIRAWEDSPDPGDDFNCRCWAEPLNQATGLTQTVISTVQDRPKWIWTDFVAYFYNGDGKTVSLSEIGLLSGVIDHARSEIFPRVESQIENKARTIVNGEPFDSFARSYDFGDVSFSLGNSTLKGSITGRVLKEDKILIVDAQVEYLFFDQFTDPLSMRQNQTGTSLSKNADAYTEVGGTSYDIVDRWLTKVTGTIETSR